eukprot:6249712-Pyramimonas_sp.AAC.1
MCVRGEGKDEPFPPEGFCYRSVSEVSRDCVFYVSKNWVSRWRASSAAHDSAGSVAGSTRTTCDVRENSPAASALNK